MTNQTALELIQAAFGFQNLTLVTFTHTEHSLVAICWIGQLEYAIGVCLPSGKLQFAHTMARV